MTNCFHTLLSFITCAITTRHIRSFLDRRDADFEAFVEAFDMSCDAAETYDEEEDEDELPDLSVVGRCRLTL